MLHYEKKKTEEVGVKFDQEKNRYDLIPPYALDAMVAVLTHGAAKYSPDNWKYVEAGEARYFSAMMRHMWSYKRGEELDPDSGHSHLAHALCNLMFLYEISQKR